MKNVARKITYKVYSSLSSSEKDQAITTSQFMQLLEKSTLAERRPVDDKECLEGMLKNSDLIVSIEKNNLKLKKIYIGKVFTYVLVCDENDENETSIGITLTPIKEDSSKEFSSLEEILKDNSYLSLSRAIALAAINAVGQYEIKKQNFLLEDNLREAIFNLIMENYKKDDKIVFVGNLKPLVKKLKEDNKDVEVFCRAKVETKIGVYNDIYEYE